jgi:hypothetical protein
MVVSTIWAGSFGTVLENILARASNVRRSARRRRQILNGWGRDREYGTMRRRCRNPGPANADPPSFVSNPPAVLASWRCSPCGSIRSRLSRDGGVCHRHHNDPDELGEVTHSGALNALLISRIHPPRFATWTAKYGKDTFLVHQETGNDRSSRYPPQSPRSTHRPNALALGTTLSDRSYRASRH